MKKLWIALAACVGLLGASSQAQAIFLLPGQDVMPGVSNALGTVLMDTVLPFTITTIDASGTHTTTGTLDEIVQIGRPGNTLGGVSFVYLLRVDAGSFTSVQALSVSNFAGFFTDVVYNHEDPFFNIPFAAARSVDGVGITFLAGFGGVNPGQSAVYIVDTNAPPPPSAGSIILSGGGGSATLFVGPAAVPEPATLTLTLMGLVPLAAAAGYRRWRRKPIPV
jgi:hypothetical protein